MSIYCAYFPKKMIGLTCYNFRIKDFQHKPIQNVFEYSWFSNFTHKSEILMKMFEGNRKVLNRKIEGPFQIHFGETLIFIKNDI